MDDYAEIGPANHLGYEKRQEAVRTRREEIPVGECIYFDEAFERAERVPHEAGSVRYTRPRTGVS